MLGVKCDLGARGEMRVGCGCGRSGQYLRAVGLRVRGRRSTVVVCSSDVYVEDSMSGENLEVGKWHGLDSGR